jgi:hypothetical protein
MLKMAFAASCLLDPQGIIILDPESSEEQSPNLNKSEHFIVYDPSNFSRSISMNHFGKFEFGDMGKVSKVMAEEAILPISEEIKNAIREKLEKL